MKEFQKAIAGTVLGAAIALAGTLYSINRTVEKDYNTEMRQKIEQVLAGAVRSNKCFDLWVAEGREPKDCIEQEPLWKAISLTELYFPELKESLLAFQSELLAGKVELERCERVAEKPTMKQMLKRNDCALAAYEKFNPSKKLEAVFEAAKTVLPKFREGK